MTPSPQPSPQSVSMLGSAYHGRGHVGDRAPMWEGRIGARAVAKDGGRKFQGGEGSFHRSGTNSKARNMESNLDSCL